jgi:mannosyltransferase OCH1-like enzyme
MSYHNLLEKSIKEREQDSLINNHYEIIKEVHNDEFSVIVYFLKVNKCKIVIRRLNDYGWAQNLKIKIFDTKKLDYQIISIGSSFENLKIMEFHTIFDLEKRVSKNINIPKKIMQCGIKNNIDNLYHYNAVISYLDFNPEFEYVFYDETDSRIFLKDNFKENKSILEAYDKCFEKNIKIDIFKYAYLYKYGGCYFDEKFIIKKPIDNLFEDNDDIVICDDDYDKSYYNGIICVCPNHPSILECLNNSVENVINNYYGNTFEDVSGNKLFFKFFSNIITKILKRGNNVYRKKSDYLYNNECAVLSYSNFYLKHINDENKFSLNWREKNFYYSQIIDCNNYTIYVLPHRDTDKFNILFLKDNIYIVRRIDCDGGWGMNLKIKIINNDNNKMEYMTIGNAHNNDKPFLIDF